MIKKILVPTDFSENADLALKYAIQVANQFGATIYVLHAYLIASSAGNLVSIDHFVKADRQQEVDELVDKMKPLLSANARLEAHVKNGNPVDSIRLAAEKMKADLIIMGTKGAGGMRKFFLGSTASQVVLHSEIPVLVIPWAFEHFRISTLTLALDDKKIEDLKILKPILDLVKSFGANLNLLSVRNEEHPLTKIDSDLEDHLTKQGVKFSRVIEDSPDVIEGIQNFVNREHSDLLCLIHHPRGFFQRIFDTSISKEMSFDSRVPLMILQG